MKQMTWRDNILISILVVGTVLELPKFLAMITQDVYYVMPYSNFHIESKSNRLWLVAHFAMALVFKMILFTTLDSNARPTIGPLRNLVMWSFAAFSLLILLNPHHIGNLDPNTSLMINFAVLFVLFVLVWNGSYFGVILVLCSPYLVTVFTTISSIYSSLSQDVSE